MTTVQALPAFHLPAALLSQGYSLRPETEADDTFLLQLYATTREQELAPVPWTEDQKWVFYAQQFQLQRLHYRTHYADTAFHVIEQNGLSAGRLYLQEVKSHLRIIDIILMPEWRGRGVGTAIVRAITEAAKGKGKGVDIFVEKFNPALHLYRRLGFQEVSDTDVYFEMRWDPEAPAG